MSMFEDIPVDIGIIYEGERIRWKDTQVELGGPREKHKFELVKARDLNEIEDGKINIIGPDLMLQTKSDINDMAVSSCLPIFLSINKPSCNVVFHWVL